MNTKTACVLVRHDWRESDEWVDALSELADLSDDDIEEIFDQFVKRDKLTYSY